MSSNVRTRAAGTSGVPLRLFANPLCEAGRAGTIALVGQLRTTRFKQVTQDLTEGELWRWTRNFSSFGGDC